jgi:predicted permease
VLLGWDLFARRFGGDRSIVGRDIVVNDQRTTVIGVMPPTFRLLLPPDSSVPDHLQVWQPFGNDLAQGPRGNLFLRVIGRMRPGVTVAQTRADLDSVAGRITREFGISRAFTTVILHADAVREIRGPLLALFVGVAILLMIACVNVASLLIARAATRTRETALRLALGASRTRLLRQSLVEGLLLTLIGAAAGTLVGYVGLQALVGLAPESLSRIHASRMDMTVLGFTLAISVAWGVLFSLAPTIAFVPPARLRRYGGPGRGPSLRPLARRSSLVVVQVALSVVLLIGAGLLARAFVEVQQVDPGFRTDRHLTFRVALPDSRYHTADAIVSAATELRRRLATLRSVTGVGAISHLPYDDLPNWYLTYALEAAPRGAGTFKADARAISTGLFEALGVQLVEGRFFKDDESPMSVVVIVDELLARQLWPGRSAIGQHFLMGQASPERQVTVVGVVRHLRLRSLVEDLAPQIFIPYRLWQRTPMAYVVRTDEYPPALAADIRAAVAAFDPQLPIYDLRSLKTYVQGARSIRRFTVLLAVAFAAAALALASIGVYGVLAYSVAVRRRELGVRRALGANTAQVMREVLREGLGFAVAGSAGGIAGAAIAAGMLRNQLYAVNPRDPITYIVALALVLGSAALACWIPARRASAISVMDAMRIE